MIYCRLQLKKITVNLCLLSLTVGHTLVSKNRLHLSATGISLFLLLSISIALFWGDLSFFDPNTSSDLASQVLLELRLPRVLTCLLIGAALAISGASLQVLLANPLAEAGMLGISGGASMAMVLTLFIFPNLFDGLGQFLPAIIGALGITFILVTSSHYFRLSTSRLLLIGVAFGIISGAVVTWAFYFSDNLNLRLLMYWLMGSVGSVTWQQLGLSVLMLPCMAFLILQSKKLDYLMLGEEGAKQLGVDVLRMRWQLILVISILVGFSVALAGVISFVGLVVPHFVRLWIGYENKYVLPFSAVLGAGLLVFSDVIARFALPSAELPLGVVTTTLGAPIFIWMLLKS